MSETKWSPEPWNVCWMDGSRAVAREVQSVAAIWAGDPRPIVSTGKPGDWPRIVAAVNACAGIPTEALETGALAKALAALGGRSGFGHNVQSSGRCDCGECHHPRGAPYHMDDCSVGRALRALGRL